MSEQVHPAAMNLEEGAEVVGNSLVASEPPAEATPEPAKPPAEDDGEPDGTIEATGGVKFVPLEAVKAERGRRKEAEKTAAEKEALIQQLKGKAEKYDQVSGYVQQAQPIIEAIRQNPDLVRLAKNPPKPQVPVGPLSDQEAVEYAKDLDLYKADGTPDVDRAQRLASRQQALAERTSRQAVAPIYQQTAIQQSAQMRAAILAMKDEQGNAKFDPQALDAVWKLVSPEESAKPEVANALAIFAHGLMYQKGGGKPLPAPPLPTESVGGGKPGPAALDGTGEAMLRASGLARKEYTAIRGEYREGQTNSLE